MIFLDTSVLVAAARAYDLRHARSAASLVSCTPQTAVVADRSLAEAFSALTGVPKPLKRSPREVVAVLERFMHFVSVRPVPLETLWPTLYSAVQSDVTGGTIHDACLLACARHAGASTIYTQNVRHFRRAAPDLAPIIREP